MIDLILYGLLLLAAIRGWRKGLVVAAFSLAGILVGLAAAIKLSSVVAARLADTINVGARWLPVIAFLAVFILVVVLIHWLARLIEAGLKIALLGWFNKLAGMLLYAVLYVSVYSVLLFYGVKAHVISENAVAASRTYPWIAPWGPSIIDFIGRFIPFFRDMFRQLEDFFDRLSHRVG